MLYNAPTGSTDPNAGYVGKNVSAGIQGSRVPPGAVEQPQRELCAIIDAGKARGLAAQSGTDLQQALRAVRSGLLERYPATGTADGMVITPDPAVGALLEGMRFRLKVPGGSPNTTVTPTLTINGLSATILRQDGLAVAAGDLIPGRIREFEIDAGLNARIAGLVASDVATSTTTVFTSKLIVAGRYKVFSAAGPWSLQLPADVTVFRARVWAPGGGGGGANSASAGGSGGGGGDYEEGVYSCPAGATLSGVIGAPGTGGSAGGGDGGSGGATTLLVNGNALITALGGGGGKGSTNGGINIAGAGGTGTGGLKQRAGYAGGLAYFVSDGTTTRGIGGAGGSAYTASGTPVNLGANGNTGASPGGGGSGSTANQPGGTGGGATIEIEY
jgi:hypothetical protein